jgi:hypothetical protein
MNFQELLSKMQELDTPVVNNENCGCDSVNASQSLMPPPVSSIEPKKDTPPPSMSVNINAQGMDNIEDMLKLMTKVNPDMINQPAKPEMPMPMPISIKPINKLIPDFDGDNDDMPGGEMDSDYDHSGDLDAHEKDHAKEKPLLKTLDRDGDDDHDMDDHDMEKDSDDEEDKEDKEEAYENEPEEDERDIDYMQNKLAGGMNRPKGTHPKVAGGDNPMQRVKEGDDLRSQIRAELLQRLAEAKGAK